MSSTSLKLVSSNAQTGAKINTSIPYVNESASSATLKQYGQMLNALTTNNYLQTDRVQTINVDTEEVPVEIEKATATITLSTTTASGTTATGEGGEFSFTYNGDYNGDFYNSTHPLDGNAYFVKISGNSVSYKSQYSSGRPAANSTITIMAPETESYKSATATFTFT